MAVEGHNSLGYIFLNSEETPETGMYTPLIIPNTLGAADYLPAQAQLDQDVLYEQLYGASSDFANAEYQATFQDGFYDAYAQTGNEILVDQESLNYRIEDNVSSIRNAAAADVQNERRIPPFSTIRNAYFKAFKNGKTNFLRKKIIDVVSDYQWTASPRSAKLGTATTNESTINDEVPYIRLKEKYFLFNNLIAQALYSVSSANQMTSFLTGDNTTTSVAKLVDGLMAQIENSSIFQSASTRIGRLLNQSGNIISGTSNIITTENNNGPIFSLSPETTDRIANDILLAFDSEADAREFIQTKVRQANDALRNTSAIAQNFSSKLTELISSGLDSVSSLGSSVVSSAKQFTGETLKVAQALFQNPDLEPVLIPYQGLYLVGSTGFEYKIPYLENNILNNANSFGGGNVSLGFVPELVENVTGLAETVTSFMTSFAQAGTTSIERTKYYDFAREGQPFKVRLPLYNTHPANFSNVVSNYRLVFLLLYQNMPMRTNKVIVEPPCVYDVTIPGGRREPFCYMSSINVKHNGNTRMMNIPTTGLGIQGTGKLPENIEAIIPDSYLIEMEFTPLIPHTKNLMAASISYDANEKVKGTAS